MNLAPIVLFVYNRPWHTQQTVEALQKNELANESELFIYSDKAKNEDARKSVDEVREYIDKIDGFKRVTIIKREKNWGLANSIIDGVTKIVNEYGKIIVLEDDLVTSPYFLKFMNDSLSMYEKDNHVASIHGYVYPIENLPDTFFIRGADCWGWATWDRGWDVFEEDGDKLLKEIKKKTLKKEVDFDDSYPYTKMLKNQIKGKNDSWAVRWYISAFLKDMLTLYPSQSYVQNIGNDSSGIHCGVNEKFKVVLSKSFSFKKIDAVEDLSARGKIIDFFVSSKLSLINRCKSKIKEVFI